MTEFEYFLLLWVLPSLCCFYLLLQHHRSIGTTPENMRGDDWGAMIIMSVLYPIGAIYLFTASLNSLTKERTFKRKTK